MKVSDDKIMLVDRLVAPPDFLKINFDEKPGLNMIGHENFITKSFTISDILHRQIGPADEILLGILSVFLIAVISDLFQTILLRAVQNHDQFANNLASAAIIDEVTHFRNMWAHICKTLWPHRTPTSGSSSTLAKAKISVVVAFVAFILFFVEVMAIVITQPKIIESKKNQYSVRGIHPAATTRGMSLFIGRTTRQRGCVSPLMFPREQTRNFIIHNCFNIESKEAHSRPSDVSDVITVGSWYHQGGIDHEVLFGNASFIIRIRTELFATVLEGSAWRLFYDYRDNENKTHAQYIQQRFILGALEWSCNKFTEISLECEEAYNTYSQTAELQTRNIWLWRDKDLDINEMVEGVVSTFKVKMNNPYQAVEAAIGFLMASAGIQELAEESMYQTLNDDKVVSGIPGLLSEQARISGVVMISIVLLVSFIVLLILRKVFQPASLASLSMCSVMPRKNGYNNDVRETYTKNTPHCSVCRESMLQAEESLDSDVQEEAGTKAVSTMNGVSATVVSVDSQTESGSSIV